MQLETLTGTLAYRFDDAGLKAAQRELAATAQAHVQVSDSQQAGAEWGEKYSQKLAAGAVVAGTFAAAGAGVTAALIDSVSAAKEYDAVMANVATLSPEAAAKTGEFKKQVLDLSASMGGNAVESANAMYDALSSGIPPDNVMTFMTSASKFAVAGATDVGTAVKGLAGTINAWGLEATEATAISDTFFQGQNLGVFRVDELASSIGNVSGLAASLGISYKDVTASTATMTLQNMTAAESITRQRAAIVSIITPNEKMATVMKDLAATYPEVAAAAEAEGISIGEAAFKTLGFQGTMEATRQSATNTSTVLAEATGSVEALGGILALTGDNADLARTNLDAMNGSAGSTEAAFKILSETTDQKWKVMTATFNNAKIALGDAFLPVVSAVLDLVSPLADGALAVARAFGEMPTPVKALVAGLGILVTVGAGVAAMLAGLAAAFGPGLIAMTGAATLTGALGAAWAGASATIVAGAGAAAAAILPLIAPILAVSAVVLALKKGHDDLAASMDKGYTSVQKMGGGFDAYLAATKKAKEETTGLGKVWATLGSNEGLDLQKSTQAWLTYGAGVDEALLKTTEFQKAQHAAGQEWQKTGDVEAYKDAMLAAADAASVAAGQGHLLSVEQKAMVTEFQAATAVLLERSDITADAMSTDEEFIATQDRLSRAVADGAMTQQQALGEMNAYIAKRGEQAAADAKAAQAAADGASKSSGAVQMYSKALQGLSGGSAVSFTPGAELDKDSQKKLDKANEDARQSQAEHLSTMYASRVEYQGKLAVLLDAGKTEEAAKLTATYQEEEGKQAAHLAQLALNQLNSLLTMGKVSEGQAQLIYGSLASAFPGSELFDASAQATMEWSSQLGQAFGGNVEAAMGLGDFLTERLPAAFDEGGASALAYKDNSVAAFEETRAAGDTSSADLAEYNRVVIVSQLARKQAAGEALTAEQQHMLNTAGVAQSTGGQIETSMRGVGGSAAGAASQVGGSMGSIKAEVASLPAALKQAADDTQAQAQAIGKAFNVTGEQARAYTREAKGAMDDAAGAAGGASGATETFGAASATAYKGAATEARGARDAVKELADEVGTLPPETVSKITIPDIDQTDAMVKQLAADIAALPLHTTVSIVGLYTGTGPMAPTGSLQLQHDLEDVYAVVADKGPLMMTAMFEGDSAAAMEAPLRWQVAVEKLNEVISRSKDGAKELAELWDQYMAKPGEGGEVGGFWELLTGGPSQGPPTVAGSAPAHDKEGKMWGAASGTMFDDPYGTLVLYDQMIAKAKEFEEETDPAKKKEAYAELYKALTTFEDNRHSAMIAEINRNSSFSEAKKGIAIARENARHQLFMDHSAMQGEALKDLEEQQRAYAAELAAAMKAAEEAIKTQQKSETDAEKSAHAATIDRIEDEARRRKGVHDGVLSDIDERKRIEAEAYAASTKALDEQARQIKAADDQRARALSDYKDSIGRMKVAVNIDEAKRQLDDLKTAASEFASVMGKLEDTKKVDADDAKRRKEKVKLTTDAQREMLRKYGSMAAAEDQRTIALLLAGYDVRGSEADRIMAGIQAGLDGAADGQGKVVDAKQAELDRLQGLITAAEEKAKVEKRASEDQLRVIDEIKRKSAEAHTEYVRQLDLEKRQEDERYKAEAAAIASLKEAEKDRHEAELKRINEQYALELLKLGKTEEEVQAILAQRAEEARRISEEADARYKAAIAAIDAEAGRLQGEQAAREAEVRNRVADMQRELIERMRLVAQAIGGEAGAAIDEMLRKLLAGDTGLPAATAELIRMGEEGVKAVVAIGKAVADLGKQEDRALRLKQRVVLPGEKLNASTRRGRGGFRAGHDWAAWHGTKVSPVDPELAGGITPDGPGGGTGIGGTKIGGPAIPNPWRYWIDPIDDVNAGLAEMNAQLSAMGMNLAAVAPNFGGVAGGWTGTGTGTGKEKIDYHHYGDNVFVGDTAAEDFLTGLHMAP